MNEKPEAVKGCLKNEPGQGKSESCPVGTGSMTDLPVCAECGGPCAVEGRCIVCQVCGLSTCP